MEAIVVGKNQVPLIKDISIIHDSTQPISRKNTCESKGCSHICVLSPGPDDATCLCPEGMTKHLKNCSGEFKSPNFANWK